MLETSGVEVCEAIQFTGPPAHSRLELPDKVLCQEIIVVSIFTECGVMLPLIFVALVLRLPVPVLSSSYLSVQLECDLLHGNLIVPAGSWLLFASTTVANSF